MNMTTLFTIIYFFLRHKSVPIVVRQFLCQTRYKSKKTAHILSPVANYFLCPNKSLSSLFHTTYVHDCRREPRISTNCSKINLTQQECFLFDFNPLLKSPINCKLIKADRLYHVYTLIRCSYYMLMLTPVSVFFRLVMCCV